SAERPAPAPVRPSKGPAKSSPAPSVLPAARLPRAAPRSPAPALPPRPTPSPVRCTGCSALIVPKTGNESCTVCGEPLCAGCEIRARAAGHKGVCPNCDSLLFRSGGRP
ncbi:MAG: hypothetical protein L3K05_04615, partial [Thermoplasmata archaeon]|nr:hypothetical protein [Thermoplasmata archaeon]